uniref:Uncharacterized protein n=1 Tax=Ceratitis capitata TaxID=7213 RepID=W8BA50_CERCA
MNNEISGKTLLSVTASIAATIIPDTPIVSIAGATLSEITTTTTSTTTTPTPTPTPTAFLPSIRANKDHGDITNLPKNPMSDAAVNKSAGGNGNAAASQTTTAINASAAADGASIAGKNSSIDYAPIENTTVNAGKTDDAPTNTTTTTDTKISDVSDLEEPELKKLLDEAYSYKAPKDKKDKSEIFLDLLQKVENEDLGIISTRSESHRHHPHSQSRHQQKQGGSLQDLLQLPSDYRRQNHTSRHKKNSSVSSRQREGGSLPSNVNVANCLLSSFGQQTNVYTDKRVRRGIFPGVDTALNSNKTLVGVVGLSVGDPNANCLLSTIEQHTDKPARRVVGLAGGDPTTASGVAAGTVAGGSSGLNSVSLCSEESGSGGVGTSVTTVSGGAGSMATTASGHNVGGTMATGTGLGNSGVKSVNSIGGSSDYIINIGDMIDIQQQQQILPSKTQDYGQILSYYDRVDIDLHIPHRSIRGDFVPARSHHYVDEVIRFPQIDGGADGSLCESGEVAISVNNLGNTLKSAAASCSLPMPLDERYRSIKSVMGEKGDVAGVGASLNAGVAGSKTSGATVIPNAGSISSVNASNNAGGVGVGVGSNGIGIGGYAKALPMSRQTDENGNDCERQQHASIVVSSTGQSQAKAKAKKKPQKDNTIPVDVVNEAGYRGKDPVEVLVKFIESTEEDGKQGGGSGNSKVAENSKKKERKKEKVKQSKMKKSNSLEELRSCAKIDVGELKRSAVTTESNNVTMRSKGSGGSKGGKNNSSSTADINKNIDGGSGKEINPTPAIPTAGGGGGGKQAAAIVNATSNHRKGERRSWGTEELQYLGNEGGNNVINVIGNVEAERTRDKKEKRGKDKDKDKDRERDVEREKDKGKDRETDKHDKLPNTKSDGGNTKYEKYDKYEKLEKTDKSDKGEKAEKTDKSEKRKKSETIMQTPTANAHESQSVERANTPVISAIELLSMNTLISETAEFHVVTKKKKPKKQRASIDETHFAHNSYNSNSVTTGGFSRGTHSAPAYAQKGGSNNNNYTNNNNNNNNGSSNNSNRSYPYDFISNYNDNNSNNNNRFDTSNFFPSNWSTMFTNNNNNNNNNANKINKQDNEDTAEGAIILKKIIATATSTANPPTTSEFDLVDTTAETAANVVELA